MAHPSFSSTKTNDYLNRMKKIFNSVSYSNVLLIDL